MLTLPATRVEDHHDFVVYRSVHTPMSDGVELVSDIYFPAEGGKVDFSKKYPVLLNRSGYMPITGCMPSGIDYYAAELGYVFVQNAVRGTYLSEGEYQPCANEGWGTKTDGFGDKRDGVDMVDWIIKQPWSNGQIVCSGISYFGNTTYSLVLAGDVPGLTTSVVTCPAVNSIDGGMVYQQDFVDVGCMLYWALGCAAADPFVRGKLPQEVQDAIKADDELVGGLLADFSRLMDVNYMAELQRTYSYEDMPIVRHIPFYQKWMENRDNPKFFEYNDTRKRKHDMDFPVLFQAGWYDLFSTNALNAYCQAVAEAPTEEISKAHRLIVGAWNHNYSPLVRRFPESESDWRLFTMEWFQQQVNGVESEYFRDNPVSLFVMGENRWRSEQEWPLSDAVPTKLYLRGQAPANGMLGAGTLSTDAPERDEAPDVYAFDPANPVVCMGGNCLFNGGQFDQRVPEMRSDVLVYTSSVLEEDVEVTGYVNATLYAATSGTDTDFFVRLLDVCPDGVVYNITSGGRRGRYIQEGRANPRALVPDQVYQYDVQMRATSYVFKRGHQIRVDIMSSDYLNADLNPNVFMDLNEVTPDDFVVATQTVHHDNVYASSIELPIVPASHERKWIDWPYASSVMNYETIQMQLLPGAAVCAEFEAGDLPRA